MSRDAAHATSGEDLWIFEKGINPYVGIVIAGLSSLTSVVAWVWVLGVQEPSSHLATTAPGIV